MKIIAVDHGDTRTGVAICDKSEFLASPLTVVQEYNFEKRAEKVATLIKENKAELVVVGYPKNMNGTIGESAEKCEKFAALLTELTGIKTVLWDERATTTQAYQYLHASGKNAKNSRKVVDAVAAVIILESYLAYRKNQNLTSV